MRIYQLVSLALLGMIMSAHGQGATRLTTPNSEQKKQIQAATDRLRQAQSNGELDKAKDTAKGLLKNLPSGVTDAAKAALQSPEAKAQAMDAVKAAAQTIMPQAQQMLNRSDVPVGLPTAAAPADQPPPPVATGPQPGALQPIGATSAGGRQPTAIIDADNSVFDPNAGIVIYTGHVKARHPQFYIECEELIVHLVKEEPSKAKAAPMKNDPISPGKGTKEKQSGIKKAFASGPRVLIEKKNPDGELQRAFCRRAEYDGITGNMKMRDNPQVQTGNVMQMATTPDTEMTFDQKGNFSSNRSTRTVIMQDEVTPTQPNGTGL